MIDVRFVNETSGMKMIVDSEAPYSIASNKGMEKYIEEAGVDKDEMEYEDCFKIFIFRENVYERKTKTEFPMIVKYVTGENIKKKVIAYIFDREEEMFLFGKKELGDWNVALHTDENRMEMKKTNRKLNLETSAGGHNLIRLEKDGQWNEDDTVFYITKRKDTV